MATIDSIEIPVQLDVTWEPPEELIEKIADRVAEKLRPYITTPAYPRQDPYPWQIPSPPWPQYPQVWCGIAVSDEDILPWN